MESSDFTSKHRNLVDSPEFQRACDFAMLELTRELSNAANDANASIPVALMIRGAHKFVETFRNLSEKPLDVPSVPPMRNLNHKA